MLSPDDARLVRRDRELPGLAHVLDADLFAEWLQRFVLPHSIESVRPRYTRYKPGTNCLVAYTIEWTGGPTIVTAKAFRPPAADKLAKAARWIDARTPLGPASIVSPELALAALVFPYDLKIRALRRVMGEAGAGILHALVPGHPADSPLTVLNYKPERRLVARWRGPALDAVVRIYTAAEYRTVSHGFSQPIPGVRVARPLGHHPNYPVMATEWIEGEDGRTIFDVTDRAAAAGEALACVHRAMVAAGPVRSRTDEQRHLTLVSGTLANLMPGQAPRVTHLARALADALSADADLLTPIHGDFAARQLVFTPDGAALTDLDAAAVGHPAGDLGSFLADLDLQIVRGDLDERRADAVTTRFLDGYASVRELPPDIEVHHAAHLLRIAAEPFRTRSREWSSETARLIDRCEAVRSRLCSQRVKTTVTGRRPGIATHGDNTVVSATEAVDPAMPWLSAAIDPLHVTELFRSLPWMGNAAAVESARIARHKCGRRCLIEYTLSGETRRVFGKVRAKGVDLRTAALVQALGSDGFGETASDGINVPQFLGVVPSLRMWLQKRADGEAAADLLSRGRTDVAQRLVHAVLKLQRHGPIPDRTHTLGDELEILRRRLESLALRRPRLRDRLARIAAGCQHLTSRLTDTTLVPAHRDFYPDQVLIDGSRLVLLDLDLYALAHPALDIGNCIAHLVERALQRPDEADRLDAARRAMHDAFASSMPRPGDHALEIFTTLTLARLIEIDDRLAHRRHVVEALIDSCEQRLDDAGAWLPARWRDIGGSDRSRRQIDEGVVRDPGADRRLGAR